jgi:hypothetical protein
MHPNPLYAECLQRAAAELGGCAQLGARLGVPARLVERWAQGRSPVPADIFLKVVDLLQERTPNSGRSGRARPFSSA